MACIPQAFLGGVHPTYITFMTGLNVIGKKVFFRANWLDAGRQHLLLAHSRERERQEKSGNLPCTRGELLEDFVDFLVSS
jgi:hypothetical protein